MAFEGQKVAKKLRSDGWAVEQTVSNNALQWTATHEDTNLILTWGPNPKVQRILTDAANALGNPVRRTNVRARKIAEAKRREAENAAIERERGRLLAYREQRDLTEQRRRQLIAEEDNHRFYERLMQPGR